MVIYIFKELLTKTVKIQKISVLRELNLRFPGVTYTLFLCYYSS